MRPTRVTARALVAAVAACAVVTLPTVAPGEAAVVQGIGCTPVSQAETQLLLPPWGDQAGWANANQYETILTADLDGDGTAELLGRNASGMEIWEWGTPFQAGPVAYPGNEPPVVIEDLPSPGQWVPSSTIPGFGAADIDGLWDISSYSTFMAGSLDGSPDTDEIVWRSGQGLIVAAWGGSSWSVLEYAGGTTGPMADNPYEQWWLAPYFSTITLGDVDGDNSQEVVGRGPDGVQSWSYDSGVWTRLDTDGTMTDGQDGGLSWLGAPYYSTMRVADVTGNGADDLIARSADGLVVWSLEGDTWTTTSGPQPWTDAAGWDAQSWYSTIGTADLDGDGVEEIFGRTAYGLDVWSYKGGTWTHLTPAPTADTPSVLTDAEGFDEPAYYETIKAADLGPVSPSSPQLVMARTQEGVAFYQLSGGAFGPPLMTESTFADANGWDSSPSRYETVTTATIAEGTSLLFGRDATGLRSFQLQGSPPNGTWVSPSAPFPAWSDTGADPGAPPPGYDPTLWSQQVNAYEYINQQWVENGFASGEAVNIREAMIPTDDLMLSPFSLPAVLGWLSPSSTAAPANHIDPPTGRNIPQDTWAQVQWQTWSWLYQAGSLQTYLFQPQNSLQTLLTEGGIYSDGNDPTDIASAWFAGKDQSVEAVVLDLIRNLISDASYVSDSGFVGGAALTMALTGSGLSTAAQLTDPESTISTTAEDLDAELASAFCAAQSYLLTAYSNAVADAGLLGAMGQMTMDGPLVWEYQTSPGDPPRPPQPPSAMVYGDVLESYTNGQTLWTWQQLAAGAGAPDFTGGWRVGWCSDLKGGASGGPSDADCASGFRGRVSAGYGTAYQVNDVCVQGIGDICTYGTQYRVLNTTCEGSSNDDDAKNFGDRAWKALIDADVGFDPQELFMPQQSTLRYQFNSTDPSAYASPVPINGVGKAYNDKGEPVNNGLMGIMGWRVPATNCN